MLRLLPLLPLLFLFACSDLGIGGACHHHETGEVLTQVRDVNGELFRVRKMPNQPTFTGTYDGCGVPVEAKIGGDDGAFDIFGYVQHPETGRNVSVRLRSERGLRQLTEYEWY